MLHMKAIMQSLFRALSLTVLEFWCRKLLAKATNVQTLLQKTQAHRQVELGQLSTMLTNFFMSRWNRETMATGLLSSPNHVRSFCHVRKQDREKLCYQNCEKLISNTVYAMMSAGQVHRVKKKYVPIRFCAGFISIS